MNSSGIDIVEQVYNMLNVPVLINALGQGGLWQHNIPQNSPYTDVCIRIPTTDAYESELRFFDIDIRTPNLKEYHPFVGLPQDNTFPNMQELDRITNIILPLIQTQGALYVETKIPGVPMRDADGEWRVNIRVEFTLIDEQDTHEAKLILMVPTSDGYGGRIPVKNQIWAGSARRINIIETPSLDKTAGAYGIYMRCSWLIAMDQTTPQIGMILQTNEGEYLITGIFPDGIFWRTTTTRKNTPYG